MLNKLIKIANDLDSRGLVKEADYLDKMITKHAWEWTSPSTWFSGDDSEESAPAAASTPLPFTSRTEGNAFRKWVRANHSSWKTQVPGKSEGLSSSGSYNNDFMQIAWDNFGAAYLADTTEAPEEEAEEAGYLEKAWEWATGDDEEPDESPSAGPLPFAGRTEGNAFRKWVRANHPSWKTQVPGKSEGLSSSGSYNNDFMQIAWDNFGAAYLAAPEATEKEAEEPGWLESAWESLTGGDEVSAENIVAGAIPFTSSEEGDAFRSWVRRKDRAYAERIRLDPIGPTSDGWTNSTIQSAWKKYGSEYLANPEVEGPSLKTLVLGKAAQLLAIAFDVVSMGMENFVTQCYVDFVGRRTNPISSRDLDANLRDCLRIIAEDFKSHKRSNSGIWGTSQEYSRVANSQAYIDRFGAASTGTYSMRKNMGKGSIQNSLVSRDPLNNIFNSLTHFMVSINGDQLRFSDTYDFNPVVNILGESSASGGARENPEFFQDESNFYEFLRNAKEGKLRVRRREGWVETGFFTRAGIENLSRFYHGLFNYSGFGVDISIDSEFESS